MIYFAWLLFTLLTISYCYNFYLFFRYNEVCKFHKFGITLYLSAAGYVFYYYFGW